MSARAAVINEEGGASASATRFQERRILMDLRKLSRVMAAAPALASLLITGCEGPQELVGVDLVPRMSHISAIHALPFRLSGEANLTSQRFAPGFPGGKSDFDGRCSQPADFVLSFSMSANAAHLGMLTAEFEHCTRIDFLSGTSMVIDGTSTMTAANGDQLHALYESADEPDGEFDEHLVFDGGSGRFENARGEALAKALCDQVSGTCVYEARGRLIYDASHRGFR